MSLGTIVAFILGICTVLGSIVTATDRPMAFFDVPSVIIVVGGTVVTCFISYETKVAFDALKTILKPFKEYRDMNASLKDEVGRIVKWGYTVQKNGLQGLENEVTETLRQENPFLAYGADLVVTGYTGTEIRQILEHMLEEQSNRNRIATAALMKMGGDAPAYGMLGTLIGLVIMLSNMSGDPASIGPSMAVALITTFYGVILARLFCIPMATKMNARYDRTELINNIQMDGLVLLAERKSPRYIQDKLNSFVDVKDQFLIDRDMNKDTSASAN